MMIRKMVGDSLSEVDVVSISNAYKFFLSLSGTAKRNL